MQGNCPHCPAGDRLLKVHERNTGVKNQAGSIKSEFHKVKKEKEDRGLAGSLQNYCHVYFTFVLWFTQVPFKSKTWHNFQKAEVLEMNIRKAKASDFDFYTWLYKGHE